MLTTYTLYTESQPQLSVERFIGNWWLLCFGTTWTALQLMANTGLTLVKKNWMTDLWTFAIWKTRFSQKVSIHHVLCIYCKQWKSPPGKQSSHKLALNWKIQHTGLPYTGITSFMQTGFNTSQPNAGINCQGMSQTLLHASLPPENWDLLDKSSICSSYMYAQ